WKGLFLVTKSGHSELFWGRYRSIASARKNLIKAKEYRNAMGRRPFLSAITVPLPGKDVGPPEWSLLNAKGTYTLQVATYYDVPKQNYFGRKRSAVEECRKLRELGYEAYYYHGPVRSHVTIGTFGPSAIETIIENNKTKKVYRDPRIAELRNVFPEHVINGNADVIVKLVRRDGTTFADKRKVRVKPFLVAIPRKKGPDATSQNDSAGLRQRR
ncbi:MAG: hypothetical protein J7M14_08430, partial [Planctomycetes bacterium]|nr:hypothetical protein [Planctomycetota bacterium]